MRHPHLLPICLLALVPVGCPLIQDPVGPTATPAILSSGESSEGDSLESLEALVQDALDRNRNQRQLSTETNGAWQILHGILAYGDQFKVETPQG
ncbi:MAG: hypothetical protein ACR2NZ_06615, partial [Rubripirellula sp.]